MNDVVALAAELLGIPSTSGSEEAAVEFVAGWLTAHGWHVVRQDVSPARQNVWASRRGGGVTLSTHLDTVPPYIPPRLDREGGKLWGRGACDAKGIAAAMMVAAQQMADEGEERIDLLFVVGEETGSDGARAANELPATSRWLVNGEPTERKFVSGAKGALRVIVRTRGRAAHSGYPHLGESAIDSLVSALHDLRHVTFPSDPVLGETTVNVGTIGGGVARNVVPPSAEAELFIRLVGDAEPVIGRLQEWAGSRAELEFAAAVPARKFHVMEGLEGVPVAYTCDIPHLSRWGTPILFGPGSIHVAHTPDEHIDIMQLKLGVADYAGISRKLLDG